MAPRSTSKRAERSRLRHAALLSAFSVACGQPPPDGAADRASLLVEADPPGHAFDGAVTVELTSEDGAEIFYTKNGDSPSNERGVPYSGPIQLDHDTLLTFIARDGERWSPPVTELYERVEVLPEPAVLARELRVDDDTLLFSARRGEPGRMSQTVRVQSVGLQDVLVEDIYITIHPESWSFWEEGAFVLETPVATPLYLRPGDGVDLVVSYFPTETIRTALLVVASDDQKHEEGYVLVDLMGRIFDF
jgi:hypothetical protein